MLVKVTKGDIRLEERGVLKGAFVTKVRRFIGELAAAKEAPVGHGCRGNDINFVYLLSIR